MICVPWKFCWIGWHFHLASPVLGSQVIQISAAGACFGANAGVGLVLSWQHVATPLGGSSHEWLSLT